MQKHDMATPEAPNQDTAFHFEGTGKEYFGIWIVNILLSILTLGIYSAWAKVRSKNYFYGNTRLAGDHFEYLAQPKQILVGRLIALGALLGWLLLQEFLPIVAMVVFFAAVTLIPLLVVRGLRFNARVSRFRNLCFDFCGTYKGAYKVMLLYPLLGYVAIVAGAAIVGFSLGAQNMMWGIVAAILAAILIGILVMGWQLSEQYRYFMGNYRYGDQAFQSKLQTRTFIKIMLSAAVLAVAIGVVLWGVAVLVGALPSWNPAQVLMDSEPQGAGVDILALGVVYYLGIFLMGVITSNYALAQVHNHVMSCTTVGELQLSSQVPVWGFVVLTVTNLALLIATLGLAYPWTKVRNARYLLNNLSVQGDLASFQARGVHSSVQPAVAEELSETFDLGLGTL